MENIEKLLSEILSCLIKNDYTIERHDDIVKIRLIETKSKIEDFKNLIAKLDEDLYIEVLKDAEKHINIREFNELCEKESCTDDEAIIIECMISYMKNEIIAHLENRIDKLVDLINSIKAD